MMIVTHADFKAVGYCNRGTRRWFARHGFDWAAFLREGIPAEVLEATGDPMTAKPINHARERHVQE